MFLSFSQTLARFGGFRLGLGLRLTKKNSIWILFIMMFVYIVRAMWYMGVLIFWLIYAMVYGITYAVKKSMSLISTNKKTD